MDAFQHFQHDFGRHLRDPHRYTRPAEVSARRAGIYAELLFNNLTGFLDACYPVSRAVLGELRWRRLNRAFFRESRCLTPWFREIPREFLDWLNTAEDVSLPPWLRELAHYEWVELALDIMDTAVPACEDQGDLLEGIPVVAPALMNLAYAWPVHRVGLECRPRKPKQTYLMVFRDRSDSVRFIELNPVSARLVSLLVEGHRTGRDACRQVAYEIGHSDPDSVVAYGAMQLNQLRAEGAILGVHP